MHIHLLGTGHDTANDEDREQRRQGAKPWKLEVTYQISVLLGRNPYVPIAPPAQVSQLLHFLVLVLNVILYWQTKRVIHSNVTTQSE
jgi:hypothetical protein